VKRRRGCRGFTLLEVLLALVVLAFGLLALARVIARASASELEAVQRAQAMTIAHAMVDRVNLNRKSAVEYVGDYVPEGPVEDCEAAGPEIVERDRCEWRNLLRGAVVQDGEQPIGAPIAARGCIAAIAPNVYVIAVAWQGVVPTEAPDNDCGNGDFDGVLRRVYSTVIQIATLGA
jgi:type IV pilus assembly protein PilV